jgi:hypothetical protein
MMTFRNARIPLVVCGALALVLMAVGCGDGDNGGASSTGTPAGGTPAGTATRPPSSPAATPRPGEASGWEGFRQFADKVDTALAADDVEFFTDRAHFSDFTCPGPQESSPCEQEGQVVHVIPLAPVPPAEPTLLDANALSQNFELFLGAAQPNLSDDFGDGTLRLYSISRRGQEGGDQEFWAVITLISSSNERELTVLRFRFQNGRWEYSTFLQGALTEDSGAEKYFSQAPEDLDWEKRQQ